MRVRATKGVSITNFFGNFFIRGTDLLALPNVTCDTAFNVDLAFDSAAAADVVPGGVISVQAALLYTTSGGERRIAVHTLARSVTAVASDLFKGVDIDSVVNGMAKNALDITLREGLDKARRRLHKSVVDVMRSYREVSASAAGGAHFGHAAGGALSRLPGAGMGAGGVPAAPAGPKLPECLELLPLVRRRRDRFDRAPLSFSFLSPTRPTPALPFSSSRWDCRSRSRSAAATGFEATSGPRSSTACSQCRRSTRESSCTRCVLFAHVILNRTQN
jgi:hypothetical protein